MGRPSRKRQRPLPFPVESFSLQEAPRSLLPTTPRRFQKRDGLRSLTRGGHNAIGDDHRATPIVHHVWGALSEADITAAATPGLSLGVQVDIDMLGVAWLLNASEGSSVDDEKGTGLSPPDCHRFGDTLDHPCTSTVPSGAAVAGSSHLEDSPRCDEQKEGPDRSSSPFCVCQTGLRAELARVKCEFEDIPPAVFKRARSACNPAEDLGSGPFLNRSAMKLANIDAIAGLSGCSSERKLLCEHVLGVEAGRVAMGSANVHGDRPGLRHSSAHALGIDSCDRTQQHHHYHHQRHHRHSHQKLQAQQQKQQEDEGGPAAGQGERPRNRSAPAPFLFADLCGGPGGFSEYLLRRRRQLGLPARGWGISLRGGGTEEICAGCRTTNYYPVSFPGTATLKDCDEGLSGGTPGGAGSARRNLSDGPVDPCAWRFDHLAPWCDVLTAEGTSAEAAISRGDDSATVVAKAADTGDAVERGVTRGGRDEEAPATIACNNCGTTLARPAAAAAAAAAAVAAAGGCGSGHRDRNCLLGTRYEKHVSEIGKTSQVEDGTFAGTDAARDSRVLVPATASPGAPAGAGTRAGAAARNATPLLEMRIEFGPKGTGDLTDEENMLGFVDAVLTSTGGRRLNAVVADGGFGAARDAHEQERLVSRLVHSEALAALLLLEEGGSFVCKLFEIWTEPTAALVYLLHRKFRRIAIVKPITSRPASGERYIICTGLLPPLPPGCRLVDRLRAKVHALQRRPDSGPPTSRSGRCTAENAPWAAAAVVAASSGGGGGIGHGTADDGVAALGVESKMKEDVSFLSFLRLSNDRIAILQAEACARIIDVASSKRGRAWAFQAGKEKGCHGIGVGIDNANRIEEGSSGKGGGISDAAALRCFSQAWHLNEL